MKLNLVFKSEAGMYPLQPKRTFGQVHSLLKILHKYASLDRNIAGDRFLYKAVSMLSFALDEAGVRQDDDFASAERSLWNMYRRGIAQAQAEVAEKMTVIINEAGLPWKLVKLPETMKFPVQVSFQVAPNMLLCAAIDELREFGEDVDEGDWVVFVVVDTERCSSRRLIGTYNSTGFACEKFARDLPKINEWINCYGNPVSSTPANSGPEACSGPVAGLPQQSQSQEGGSAQIGHAQGAGQAGP